ncbi:MAG: hypothetical protein V1705_00165 [bacterium]
MTKKVLIISLIILPLFILAGLAFYFLNQIKTRIIPSAGEKKEETLAEKQIKELDELRQKANDQPLSQKQIQKQLEELDRLRLSQ